MGEIGSFAKIVMLVCLYLLLDSTSTILTYGKFYGKFWCKSGVEPGGVEGGQVPPLTSLKTPLI